MERHERLRETVDKLETEFGDAIQELQEEVKDKGLEHLTTTPREYRIRKSITPESLKSLSLLPFEVLLSEHDAGTTLVRGAVERVGVEGDQHTTQRSVREAKYTLHNHPNIVTAASPSDDDLRVSKKSKTEIDFIVVEDGIIVHKFSPESGVFVADRYWDDPDTTPKGTDWTVENDLTHGLVDALIPWGDTRVQDICDYLNGKTEWMRIREKL